MHCRNARSLSSAHSRDPWGIPPTPYRDLSGPLALAEYGHTPAVGMNTIDVNFIRADHPVDVDKALVAALRCNLLGRQLGAVDEAFRIALAERDMTGGILVEQCVEEQQTAFRDRR